MPTPEDREKTTRPPEPSDEPGNFDWPDWEGVAIPDRGHGLATVRGDAAYVSVYDERSDREVVLMFTPREAEEFGETVISAARAAAANVAGIPPCPRPE